jgi:hypothetical protein
MKKSNALEIVLRPTPRPLRWDQVVVARYIYELARGLA